MEAEHNLPSIAFSQCTSISPCSQFVRMLAQCADGSRELKILDIMLLSPEPDRHPLRWLFTDTQGFFSSQDILSMGLNDLIKAILGNIEGSAIGHSDLLVSHAVQQLKSWIETDDRIRGDAGVLRHHQVAAHSS